MGVLISNDARRGKVASRMTEINDEFELWDLRIEVVGEQDKMVCGHTVGDHFELSGENLRFPVDQPFSIYALAAVIAPGTASVIAAGSLA